MANKGQNLIEFLILLTLVVVSLIFGLTLLGSNVNKLFSKTNEHVSKYSPFGNPVEAAIKANKETEINESVKQSVINGIPVNYNEDGSASFEIEGQKINLSSTDIELLNDVFNTVGGDAITEQVIAAYQTLIDAHSSNGEEVPIELNFGKVSRQEYPSNDSANTYLPVNDHNVVSFSVGEHQVMLQKDQDCKGPVSCDIVHKLEFDGSSRGGLETESEYMNGYNLVDITYEEKGYPTSAYLSRTGEFGSPGGVWWFEW